MRRTLAGITLGLCISLTACGTAARSDETSSATQTGSKISFDGADTKYVPAPFNDPSKVSGDVEIPFTMNVSKDKVRKAAADFTLTDDGRKTVTLDKAGCANPGVDDIIPISFTVHYKNKDTSDVELGVGFKLKVEDSEGNEIDRNHPLAISIAWLHPSGASCGSSLDDKFEGPSSLSDGRSLRGAIVLHGGAANYKGAILTIEAGLGNEVSNVSGAKQGDRGIEMPLLS